MSKHTPGPWTVWTMETAMDDDAPPCDMLYLCEARAFNGDLREARANARLIAAAPDLLAALERAQEELRLIRMKDTNAVYDIALRTDISAAIARAKGEA